MAFFGLNTNIFLVEGTALPYCRAEEPCEYLQGTLNERQNLAARHLAKVLCLDEHYARRSGFVEEQTPSSPGVDDL